MEDLIIQVGNKEFLARLVKNEMSNVVVDGKPYTIEVLNKYSESFYSLSINNKIFQIEFDMQPDGEAVIFVDGFDFNVSITDETRKLLKQFALKSRSSDKEDVIKIKAPMPGMVIKIMVNDGDKVVKGDTLAIIEAMKMENALKTSFPGTVKNVRVQVGKPVEKGAILMEIITEN
jgi:biotin carboxyl carrier protein